MKKTGLLLLTAICILGFTGCHSQIEEDIAGSRGEAVASSSTEEDELEEFTVDLAPDRIALAEYQSQYEAEVEKILETDYNKIQFSEDCEISPIDKAETVGIYQLCEGKMGVDESIEIIKNWLKETGHEDLDLEAELQDATGQHPKDENMEWPYVYDYYPDFESGRGFFINTNKCQIQMSGDGIYSMSDGSITAYLGLDVHTVSDAMGAEGELVDSGSVAEKGAEVWELTDGEMSIADAAELVREYFEAGTPGPNTEGVSVDVPWVEVYTLNDKYEYAFQVRRIYKGVPFSYVDWGGRTYYGYMIDGDTKWAYVINHDTVSAFAGYSEAQPLEPLMEEQTEIIRMQDAAALLDEFLADKVRLEVGKAGLAYCIYSEMGTEDKVPAEIAIPCWEFESVNRTNDRVMTFYVNVLSGEIYYYGHG